jgi:hypothetical protein
MRTVFALLCLSVVTNLLAPVHAAEEEDKDPFAAGAIWVGTAKAAMPDAPEKKMVLTVTERMGGKVGGEISFKNPKGELITVKVSGTAPQKRSGAVILESEKVGIAQFKLRGKLQNNAATLVITGTGPLGGKGGGVVVFTPQN